MLAFDETDEDGMAASGPKHWHLFEFIARRKTDRIGVVVFGREAYILSPPTLDKSLLASLVSKMDLGLIDGNGTAIGDAVGTSVARLRRSTARSKAIILLTDGDSNDVLDEAGRLIAVVIAEASVEERTDPGLINEKIRVELRRYLRKRTGRRPMVLPVVMEI